MNPICFHAGDAGDIIASLPTVRALGTCHYIIGERHAPNSGRESMKGRRYDSIRPLLAAQTYIKSVEWGSHRGASHDFSLFRRNHIYGENLAQWQARGFGIEISEDPWLSVEPSHVASGRTIFARSARYHNPMFDWRAQIKRSIRPLFVGTPAEHEAFQKAFACKIDYLPTPNLLDLAQVIAGCREFVGNQSCPFWIAAGLGVPITQETSHLAPDSIIKRPNCQYPVAPSLERDNRPMNVIIPFHKRDAHQAQQLIEWIRELGQPQHARFFIMTQQRHEALVPLPEGWNRLTDWACIESDWSEGGKDATGANSMWQQAAREMHRRNEGPWLWLEPDAVPCRADWLDALRAEYLTYNKPFLGARVSREGLPPRMSGVAIYSPQTPRIAVSALMSGPVPFDQAGASDFLSKGRTTPLIVDEWRRGFSSQEDFDNRVPRDTALHHGCRDGTIYPYLRSRILRKEGGEIQEAHKVEVMAPSTTSPNATFRVEFVREETFSNGLTERLDWIMDQVGDSKVRRMALYDALKARGIECGRKKRSLQKAVARAQ